ncbi:hypothetical protein [Aeromicrobium wangtongii]|uniref:hypothetical protein n=1 Tax=Aeromicrobium wangtongii TaxID=2969247 RepID=UPI0020174DA6|nr:hypothetical protein [Aeromicrobium wangtongii]MCL3819507.1 hypothetical protein [Aeromicrobium wangtongii]
MAGDLQVDYDLLHASIRTLTSLRADFDDIKSRGKDTEDLWGHRDIRGAIDKFTSNMDHHREELSKEIEDVGEKLEATIDTFQDADQKLADELEKNTAPAGGPR